MPDSTAEWWHGLRPEEWGDLLNIREAAIRLRCSGRTVYRLVRDGTLRSVRLAGHLLIDPKSVDQVARMPRFPAAARSEAGRWPWLEAEEGPNP